MIVFWRYATLRRTDARAPARARHHQHRKPPEGDHACERRNRRLRGVGGDEEDPDEDRDEVEDADDVIDGGVIGALLVPLVEAVDLREQDESGQRREEEEVLGRVRHVVDSRPRPEEGSARGRTPPFAWTIARSPRRTATGLLLSRLSE
jgi:hypothetical protein